MPTKGSNASASCASAAAARIVSVEAKKKAMEKATTKLEEEVAMSFTSSAKARTNADRKLIKQEQHGITDNYRGSEWTPMVLHEKLVGGKSLADHILERIAFGERRGKQFY